VKLAGDGLSATGNLQPGLKNLINYYLPIRLFSIPILTACARFVAFNFR